MRNEKSRSGQNVTNTFPKIGSPRTVPNVRLSIATLRLSPSRKYCSFGTLHGQERLGRDVVELDVVHEARCRHDPRPRRRARRDPEDELAVARVLVRDDVARLGLGRVDGDDVARLRVARSCT